MFEIFHKKVEKINVIWDNCYRKETTLHFIDIPYSYAEDVNTSQSYFLVIQYV
jgi:hypothetical protein